MTKDQLAALLDAWTGILAASGVGFLVITVLDGSTDGVAASNLGPEDQMMMMQAQCEALIEEADRAEEQAKRN